MSWAVFINKELGGGRDFKKARTYWSMAASSGLETAWVNLVKLDYVDDADVDADTLGEKCNNEFFESWKSWVSSSETSSLSFPAPPSWLEKYIEMTLGIKGGAIENKEFWYILAMIRLLAQQQQAKHLITKQTVLYHFTRFDVLEKLLPNPELDSSFYSKNVLRCYHVSYMNDPSEGRRLLDFYKTNRAQDFPSAVKGSERLRFWFESEECGSYFHQLDNAHIVSNIPASVFTVSFTQRPDSLDLWRAYGDNGKGISIGFPIVGTNNLYLKSTPIMASVSEQSPNSANITAEGTFGAISHNSLAMEQDFEARYYEVAYGDDKVAEALSTFTPLLDRLNQIIADAEGNVILTEIARTHITESLLHILYLFKDESYSSEKEVRAIKIHPLHHSSVRRDERSPRRLYCELPNCSLFTATGTQIIVGPRVDDSNAMIWDARHLLTLHGYGMNVTVKRSEVKYR